MINFPKPAKPALHLPYLEDPGFTSNQPQEWQPGDLLSHSEALHNIIGSTMPHWIRRIPIKPKDQSAPKHLDLSRLLSIESCGVLNPPSFHSNSFITCIPSYRPSDHLFGRPIQASIIHLAHPESQPATVGPWSEHAGPSHGLFGTLTLPVDCSGDFGPLGLSFQYTQDVCGCPSAHTGRPCVSVSTHRTPGAVRVCLCVFVSTNRTSGAVRVCLCVSVSTHRTFMAVQQYTYQTAVGLRQHTPDIRGCPCVSVCVRLCPSANTGRPWLSISTHISTLVLGLSMLALPVDCLGDFGPRGLSVQYTHDVRGSPPANTARLCLSVAVRQHTQDVCGCPCVSVAVRQHAQDVRSCLWLSVSTQKTSVCVRQHPQDVCVFPCVPFRTHMTSVAVHQYTYQHAGPWTQHAGPWTQHAVPSCGLFGTSVCVRQHTQDIWGCPCVSVCVRVCPSAHTGRTWLSISTHINTLVLGLSTLTLPADCSGDFGPRGLCVQYTQDVRGCLPAHTVLSWLSVCVRVCPSVPIRTHRRLWLSISTHISTLVNGLCTLALPVDCLGDFGPRGLSVQYTHDVSGCPSAHTGHPCVFVSTHRTSRAVHVCLCVSVSTHMTTYMTSVGVCQHTQYVRGFLSASVCVLLYPSAHKGCPWLSISTHISTLVLGVSTLALPMDCLGDFGPRGLSVQYTQDVRWCPPAQHRTSVGVRSNTYQHVGPWTRMLALPVDCLGDFGPRGLSVQYTHDVRGSPPANTARLCLSVAVRQHTQDVCGCPCVSVAVRQHAQDYTYQHAGPWTQHAGPWTQHAVPSCGLFGTSVCVRQHTQDIWGCLVCVRVCPSAHTGRTWLSISIHINTLVLGLSTLTLPADCSGDFGPRGLCVQYTQDVRGCLPAHTVLSWLSVCVRVCPSVPIRTHRRLWLSISTHISTLVNGLCTLALPVDCLGDFGPRGLSVQYTHDVSGCPSAHTGHPCVFVSTHRTSRAVHVCLCVSVSTHMTTYMTSVGVCQHTQYVRGFLSASVCVLLYPSAHKGCPWLSISTHISTLVLGVSTLAFPMDCLGDFGPRGLSVQYTQDVRGCPPAHTGRPWVSVSTHISTTHRTSVGVRQHTQDVRVCSSAHTGRPWLSISTHISTLVLGLSTLTLPVNCSGDFGPRGLSGQYTQDVRGCPPAHIGHPCLSVCVRLCPSAHIGHPWLSINTHISTLVLGLSTLALPVDCLGDLGPRGLTFIAVYGCPSAHTGRACVSVSTHRTFVCVHVCPAAHAGRLWLSISTHISTLVLGLRTLALPVDCFSDFGPRGLSVQYTHDVCGCPSEHTGRPTHFSTLVLGLSTLALPVDCLGDFGPRGLSGQYTQDGCGCPPAHTGHPWLSVCVRLCPSENTERPWLSISTHISTLVLGLSMLALPVDCLGDFGPRGLCVQYIQDVRGSPPAHTARLCLSVAVRQHTQDVRGCPCVSLGVRQHAQDVRSCLWLSVSTHRTSVCVRQHTQDVCVCPYVPFRTHMTSVAVHQYTYQHAGPWTQHAVLSCGLFG
ncbi:hypothetical protein IGI04_007063 [Brassica rapa subsp. trilocularis]|uniref:Uncharacterized protein n=1 Tax=Brassica rapa subsp. trilocularis TaxID=1813537 RepID=A0ABQ7NLV8_BRACM|nr:hypothetical protein IGI04_007063 [Brassica rapa subsp. trilocularis]